MNVYPIVAYVAGPYRGATKDEVRQNIERARRLGLALWKCGIPTIIPHANTALFDGHAPDEVWLDGDLEILKRCDVLVLTHDWEKSAGAKEERRQAGLCGMPTFVDEDPDHPMRIARTVEAWVKAQLPAGVGR